MLLIFVFVILPIYIWPMAKKTLNGTIVVKLLDPKFEKHLIKKAEDESMEISEYVRHALKLFTEYKGK